MGTPAVPPLRQQGVRRRRHLEDTPNASLVWRRAVDKPSPAHHEGIIHLQITQRSLSFRLPDLQGRRQKSWTAAFHRCW